MLRIKLQLLDQYIAARRAVATAYDTGFANIPQIVTPFQATNQLHVFHQYTMQLNGADRNKLQAYLQEKQVPAMIYYPVPAHRQKMFEGMVDPKLSLPVTDSLTGKVISLPIHTEMDADQLTHIIDSVKSFLN